MRTLAIMALCLDLGGCANALDAQVQSIHALKVRDAMNDYEKASAGAPLDRCVKAKLVALAYEDSNDPVSASAWHAREKADCEAAIAAMGVSPPPRAAAP
jgi:hypothetical protein